MTEQTKDWIELARHQYIYESDEDSPYPQESIDESEKQEIMKLSKQDFRRAIKAHLPAQTSQVSELMKKINRREHWTTKNSPKDSPWTNDY